MPAHATIAAVGLTDRFGGQAQFEALRLSFEARLAGHLAEAEHWLAVSAVIVRRTENKTTRGT